MLVNIFSANKLSTLSTFNWGKLQLLNVDFFVYIILIHVSCTFAAFAVFCAKPFVSIIRFPPDSFFFIHIIHISAVDCLCRMCSGKRYFSFQFSCAIMHWECRRLPYILLVTFEKEESVSMANIKLHSDSPVSATSVSNTFIDEYMSDANGEFVKIYLYLLRLMNAPQASFFPFLPSRTSSSTRRRMSSVPLPIGSACICCSLNMTMIRI